jgi:hypothetical protein
MKKAAKILLSADYSQPGTQFQVVVQGRALAPQRVFFEYCPFCGTRLDEKFLITLKRA